MTASSVAPHSQSRAYPDVRSVAAERLTFFADAVVAIAITLLALELPVPSGQTNGEVLHSVAEHRGEYMAFLISFLVIGAYWNAHHMVFRYVTALGGGLSGWTRLWLLIMVVTPFATKVITRNGAFEARFTFYAALQAAAGVVFLLMIREIRRHRLYREDTPPAVLSGTVMRVGLLTGAFLVSIPVSFFTHWAYLCWISVPLLRWIGQVLMTRRANRS